MSPLYHSLMVADVIADLIEGHSGTFAPGATRVLVADVIADLIEGHEELAIMS